MITVSDLYYYPIKSCAGTRVESAEVTRHGLANDRMLMVVRADGKFMTQREFPQMCLIDPRVSENQVSLKAPGMPEFGFSPTQEGATVTTKVWGDDVRGIVQSADVNEWFSSYLKSHVQLVAFDEEFERRVDGDFAVAETDVVGFADGFSMLLVSAESLEHLNAKLEAPVDMNRFRPNIVVTGCDPHAEDTWKALTVGDVAMSGVKPCARCTVIGVEQKTGERGNQPTAVLAEYRRFTEGVMFGMNMIHHATGRISVGDQISVTAQHGAEWLA